MALYEALFEPYELKHLTLKNRIISTPHGPAYAEHALPQERYQAYHEEKAKGGLAMTMFGGSSNVSPDSPSLFGQLYLGDDRIIPHFRTFSERIHAHGVALMCQITHMGHRVPWDQGDWLPPISASNVRDKAHRAFPKAMETWDIERVIRDYGQAARRCRDGGLDGCELAVTGHLTNQFLMPGMNKRSDEYGGPLKNRLRFTLEALGEIRRQVGDDYIVGLRFPVDERCEGGMDADDCIAAARLIVESGMADFFNVYAGTPSYNPIFPDHIPGMAAPFAPYLESVARFKQAVGRPVFHATRMHDVAAAERGLREGALDLVGMTRAHMADPYFVSKLQRGEEQRIRPCVGASYCIDRIYMGGEALCLHNPATGRERDLPQRVARSEAAPRRVVVVGAGPAGLEAARVSAERGHEVVLFEASKELGGQVAIAARASWRRDLLGIVRWLADEVDRLGVDVRTNLYAEASDVLKVSPDVVIVATGGLPDTDIGEGTEQVISVWDALTGPTKPGGEVLVYDLRGDHQALCCAQALAEAGCRVEVVTPDQMMGQEIGLSNSAVYLREFDRLGIRVTLNTELAAVRREGSRSIVRLKHAFGGSEQGREVDTVVVEQGVLPLDELYFSLKDGSSNLGEVDLQALLAGSPQQLRKNPDGAYQLFRVGDAVASRNIHAAIFDALRLCKDL